jgi:hypothetical protein
MPIYTTEGGRAGSSHGATTATFDVSELRRGTGVKNNVFLDRWGWGCGGTWVGPHSSMGGGACSSRGITPCLVCVEGGGRDKQPVAYAGPVGVARLLVAC